MWNLKSRENAQNWFFLCCHLMSFLIFSKEIWKYRVDVTGSRGNFIKFLISSSQSSLHEMHVPPPQEFFPVKRPELPQLLLKACWLNYILVWSQVGRRVWDSGSSQDKNSSLQGKEGRKAGREGARRRQISQIFCTLHRFWVLAMFNKNNLQNFLAKVTVDDNRKI